MKRGELLKAIESYFVESDVSDIVENADYHARILLSILDSEGALRLESDYKEQVLIFCEKDEEIKANDGIYTIPETGWYEITNNSIVKIS